MRMLRSSQADFETAFGRIVRDRRESDVQVGRDVAAIINEVRERGDDALADYTARFDSHGLSQDGDWQIDLEECRAAYEALDSDLRDALETAAGRIRAYHEGQLPADRDYTDDIGMRLGARWNAVDAAGLYVPSGRAAYPSSLLMNAIPAKVAGVQRLVVTTPTPKGEVNPLVLAAAIANIAIHGLDWGIAIPLILGSVPGTLLGAKIAPRVPQSYIRRGIVVVLTMSGVALLDKAGWAPLGREETHPVLIGVVGLAVLLLLPIIWGFLRKEQGLPFMGAPTVSELDTWNYAGETESRRDVLPPALTVPEGLRETRACPRCGTGLFW